MPPVLADVGRRPARRSLVCSRGVFLFAALACSAELAARADGTGNPETAQTPPAPSPAPQPPPESIDLPQAIDRAVKRVLDDAEDPCALAKREGKPCFSVSVARENEGPTVSVADDLRRWRADGGAPREGAFRPGRTPQGTLFPGVSFDPVCAGKFLLRKLGGKNTTFYLYRVWDRNGERASLREAEMTPSAGPVDPDTGFVLVRKLTGVCEAMAAYDALNLAVRERNSRRADPVPSPAR